MTKEEILAMEPGTELDILVAEKVMNHPMPDFISEDALDLYLAGTPIHCDSWTCVCRYDEGDIPQWVPATYSTDISAAWQALKKLREEYWCIEIKIADGCWVIMELLRTPPIRVEVNAGTPFERLPEAICKAALIATDAGK
ncbi:hypothetical protein ES703_43538 [subsurface metagenome]